MDYKLKYIYTSVLFLKKFNNYINLASMQKNVICTAIFMALIVCTLSGVCRMGYYTDSNG